MKAFLQDMFSLFDEWFYRGRRTVEDGGRVEDVLAEFDLPAADSRDVQEIIDQPRQVIRLPRDDAHRPVNVLLEAAAGRHADGVADGRQRVPQLVGRKSSVPPIGRSS